MIVYNVTIKVDAAIAGRWLDWMLDIHIPEVLGTGCFVKHQVLKLLDIDDGDGQTYAIQYYAESKEKYHYYIDHYAAALREESTKKWGDQFVYFRTVMEVVN